jgi:hypothetical protein
MLGMKAKPFSLITALLSMVTMIGCAQTPIVPTTTPNPTEPPKATIGTTPSATSTLTPRSTETIPPLVSPPPTPLFTSNRVLPGFIFAASPVGGQWLMGVSQEMWGIVPDGSTKLLFRYTPSHLYWPWARLSPDETTFAFGTETGGTLYYSDTGKSLQFRGVDVAYCEPSAIVSFAWSADGQSLYYNVFCHPPESRQIWRIQVNNPGEPQLLAKDLRIQAPAGNYELYPTLGLPDGRLLMEYYPTEESNTALWNLATNHVIALTYQGAPIHLLDTQGMQAAFYAGPQPSLLIGRFGDQAEMIDVVEAQPPDAQSYFSPATFLPDGRIVAVWRDQPTNPSTTSIVLLTPGDTGYSMTLLIPKVPDDTEIAVYGDRLIVEETTDTGTGQTVLLQVPLDGSPAIPLAEGMFQIVTP